MHGIILKNAMTLWLFLGQLLSSVPVKKQKHLHQLIVVATYFSILMTFRRPFLEFFFAYTRYSLDELSHISSSLDLSKALSLRCLQ